MLATPATGEHDMTSTTEAAVGPEDSTDESTASTDSTTATQSVIEPPKDGAAALRDPGKLALDAERRAKRAAEKRANEAEAKLKEIADANLSEVEKAKRDAAEATERANKLERDALRFKVANDKQLPAWLSERLVGDTEDELSADADKMLAELKTSQTAPAPRPDLSQGSSSSSGDQSLNGDPLLRDLKTALHIP